MSEEIKNEDVVEKTPIVPAMLAKGEPVIPANKLEEFKKVVDKLVAENAEEADEDSEESVPEVEPEKADEVEAKPEHVAKKPVDQKATAKSKEVKPAVVNEKVAVYSSKNLTWNGVGKLYRGYTIVSAESATKWVNHPAVRLATPEEVAKEFKK
jgi:hypothetical protein